MDHSVEGSSDLTCKICDSFRVFADELGKVFGDPNAQQHAQDRLTRLEQTKSAAAYAAQFRQYSLRSGIKDEGLLQLFYQSLKKDVKDRLCAEDRPTTLNEYTTMTIRIDIRLHKRRQQRARDRPTQRQVYTKRETRSVVPGTHPEPMDIEGHAAKLQKHYLLQLWSAGAHQAQLQGASQDVETGASE